MYGATKQIPLNLIIAIHVIQNTSNTNAFFFCRLFVDYGLMATYFSAGCVYIVFIGSSLEKVINAAADLDWNVRIYILLTMIPILVIGQIRTLKYLVPFSALANLFIVVTFGITLYYIFKDPLVFDDKPNFSSFATLPLFFRYILETFGQVRQI